MNGDQIMHKITGRKTLAMILLATAAALFVVPTDARAQEYEYLPEHEYYGYKVVHHIGVVAEHLEQRALINHELT